ncbi:MAG TPA: hypothetical protein VHV26_01340 [Rhizomicrobium sp.]|jgi:hypothetical protein|nr:hypothetical protein [Rhizomicrobium sp.]
MIFGSDLFTNIHVAISLVAIVFGFVFLFQLLGGTRSRPVTAVFLLFTILTSVTGFFFKQTGAQPTPGQVVGVISLVLLAVALLALYGRNLRGHWRGTFLITALTAQWLNVFVLIIQLFQKIPALQTLAPGVPPSGPVFGGIQGVALLFFIGTGLMSLRRFQPRMR